MTKDEELDQLRAERTVLYEEMRRKDEELQQAMQAINLLREHNKELEGQVECLQERLKTLQGQLVKVSIAALMRSDGFSITCATLHIASTVTHRRCLPSCLISRCSRIAA
jgi:FtsZ-binding cell division protein ZapB